MENRVFKKYLQIDDYPLYYGAQDEQILKKLPERTILNIGFDDNLKIIRLDINPGLEKLLDETYGVGSNPSVALGKGLIQNKILNSIVKEIEFFSKDKEDFSIVEIGCGEGRLLQALNQKSSWTIKGFEIAPTAEVARKLSNEGIEIINDFYKYDKLDDLTDIIFSYGVLEHIIDIEDFFAECYKGLKNNGVFCHIVPDCENMLKQGNIRILSHQHVNYFTKDSMMNLYRKLGFVDVGYKIVNPGNTLMVYGYKKESEREMCSEDNNTENILSKFTSSFSRSLTKLNDFIDINKNKNIVFYAGGMQEYLILNRTEKITFTNGDSELFGKKFYLNIPAIVSPQSLKSIDIDIIVIFASHYINEIKSYLLNSVKISPEIKIISIDDIIE